MKNLLDMLLMALFVASVVAGLQWLLNNFVGMPNHSVMAAFFGAAIGSLIMSCIRLCRRSKEGQ